MFVENPDSWELLIFIMSKLPTANLLCPDLFVASHPYSVSVFAEILCAVEEFCSLSCMQQIKLHHKSTGTKVFNLHFLHL